MGGEVMKGWVLAMFTVLVNVMSNAQSALSVSDKYPLMAHIKRCKWSSGKASMELTETYMAELITGI
jgi:hypothetical protein